MLKIFIVIPCYNEAKTISEVVKRCREYGTVIVVDDGSKDNSQNFARESGALVARHYLNRGQGAALETGDQLALTLGADIVVHFDADGQHLAEEIPRLIAPIENGEVEVVFGSRFLNSKNKIPFIKKWLILKPAIFFQNLLLKVKLSDVHNGFRVVSKNALQKISLRQDGMAHGSEIVSQTVKNKLKYLEVPVTIRYNEFGQGFMGGLKIIKDLFFGAINK